MKKLILNLIVIFLFIGLEYPSVAQMNCGTDEMLENYSGNNQNYPAVPGCPVLDHDFTIEIPVIVHVMYNDDFENVDYQQVVDMINMANNQLLTDNVYGHEVNISLKLAENSTCETGYERNYIADPDIYAESYSEEISEDQRIKSDNVWEASQYLNIWIVRSINWGDNGGTGGFVSGYGTFPFMEDFIQGIVLDDDNLNVLIHEFGHYSDLYHVWWNSCVADNGCSTGDYCDDIISVKPLYTLLDEDECSEWQTGFWSKSNATTDGLNPLCDPPYNEYSDSYFWQYPSDNFMTYELNCWYRFSPDQYIRMVNCYEGWRNQLGTGTLNIIDLSDDVDHTLDELLSKMGISIGEMCNSTEKYRILLGGNLILDSGTDPVCFSNETTIKMMPNAKISVINNTTLNIDNVHIFGCDEFWDRIYIESGSTVNISGNSLIEDGRTAIFAQRGANVNIDNTVFNNNNTGVRFDGTGVGQRTNVSISNTTFKSDENYVYISDGSSFSRPYCGINVGGQNRVYLRTDASNKNYFQRLQNGIVAYNSSIRVAYSEFSDIHKDSDIESPYLLSRHGYAVKILFGNSISSANHNIITDSDYGIGAKSGGYLIAFANTISVDRIGVLGVQLDKIRVKANTISAAEKGVFVGESENMHVYFSQIFDNYVTITSNDEAAKAVDIQSTNNMDIFNNTIETLNNEAGIMLNIANNTRLENNTIDIYENGSFVTNGVKITSSTDLDLIYNLIEDFSGPSTDNIGINTEAGDAEYLCNFTYFMDEGMHFTGNSDFTRLLGNNYNYNQRDLVIGDAAVTGSSSSESWIGTQYEGNKGYGNIWTDDDSRVHNSATENRLKWSEFRVNGFQDSRYMPDHVEAEVEDKWFDNDSEYENMHPCDDDPGSDLPPKYNCAYIIKRILQIDTMSKAGDCQKIVWMYRYYKKLVKLKNKHLLSDDCLTFINSRKDSVMVQLSDISLMMDSIAQLQQNTSSLLVQLIDLDDRLTDLSDQNMEGTKEWNEVLVEYDQKSLEYQNALEVENTADLTQLDSLENVLNDVSVIDSCLKVLKKTYKTKLKWMKADSLTNPELQYLKEVAEYCPDEYGESVYQARAMLSSYENRRYPTMIECSSGDVAPRSAESSNSQVKKMQIFPNPASDKVNIVIKSGKDIEGKVEIMDVKGKLLYSLEVNKYKTSFEVDIKDFNSGLYLVKYKSKTGTVNIDKLIISK